MSETLRERDEAITVAHDTWGPIRIIPDEATREAWKPITPRHRETESKEEDSED